MAKKSKILQLATIFFVCVSLVPCDEPQLILSLTKHEKKKKKAHPLFPSSQVERTTTWSWLTSDPAGWTAPALRGSWSWCPSPLTRTPVLGTRAL